MSSWMKLSHFSYAYTKRLGWRSSGNVVGHISEVNLRRPRVGDLWQVYHPSIHPGHSGPLSLATLHGNWCNKYRRWFRPPLGKKRQVLRSSRPCDQTRTTGSSHTILYASSVESNSLGQRSKGISSDGPRGICVNCLPSALLEGTIIRLHLQSISSSLPPPKKTSSNYTTIWAYNAAVYLLSRQSLWKARDGKWYHTAHVSLSEAFDKI